MSSHYEGSESVEMIQMVSEVCSEQPESRTKSPVVHHSADSGSCASLSYKSAERNPSRLVPSLGDYLSQLPEAMPEDRDSRDFYNVFQHGILLV